MAKKARLTKKRLAELAGELVNTYKGYLQRHENPFASQERTSLDDVMDKLEKLGLASFYVCEREQEGRRIFKIVDRVHGSPAMFAHLEPIFLDKGFAIVVRDELKRTGVYRNARVVEEVG